MVLLVDSEASVRDDPSCITLVLGVHFESLAWRREAMCNSVGIAHFGQHFSEMSFSKSFAARS